VKYFTIFNCPKNKDWGVSEWHPEREAYVVVCYCDDEATSREVKRGLELRDQFNRLRVAADNPRPVGIGPL